MASAKRKGDPVSENADLVFVVVDERELHVMGNAIGRAVIERETGVTSQPWLPAAMVWADAPDDWQGAKSNLPFENIDPIIKFLERQGLRVEFWIADTEAKTKH
jgi:hypothetical protein